MQLANAILICENQSTGAVEVWEWLGNFILHTLLGMWLLIHAGIVDQINHCY